MRGTIEGGGAGNARSRRELGKRAAANANANALRLTRRGVTRSPSHPSTFVQSASL